MDTLLDIIRALQPQDYRDNEAASSYAFENIVIPPPSSSPENARALRTEILRLKREKDGPR